MSQLKAVLFDMDGVLAVPGEPFSHQYAKAHGFDPTEITPFFKEAFQKALVGEADLRELLDSYREVWRYDGDIGDLMQQWFEAENHPNEALVAIAERLKASGVKIYLATNQENYRTRYISEVMFPDLFNGVFSSAQLGLKKPNAKFYEVILDQLALEGMTPNEIIYFDDDEENTNSGNKAGIRSILYNNIKDVTAAIGEIQ